MSPLKCLVSINEKYSVNVMYYLLIFLSFKSFLKSKKLQTISVLMNYSCYVNITVITNKAFKLNTHSNISAENISIEMLKKIRDPRILPFQLE